MNDQLKLFLIVATQAYWAHLHEQPDEVHTVTLPEPEPILLCLDILKIKYRQVGNLEGSHWEITCPLDIYDCLNGLLNGYQL